MSSISRFERQPTESLRYHDLATTLREAIDGCLNVDGVRTGGLGGKATAKECTAALVRRIKAG